MHPLAAKLARLVFHPYVLFLLVGTAVWWRDGFNIGGVSDEWVRLGPGYTLINLHNTRLFNSWPYALSKILAREDFRGWQYVLFGLTLLRGILWFEVVKRLFPRNLPYAVACGLIAMFHPADSGFFWLGCLDAHFALVLAFACCLAALIYLQTGSLKSQIAMFFFQFMSCFTYTGFLLVIIAFPMSVWALRKALGHKDSVSYLLKVSVPVCVFMACQAILAYKGVGREGVVLDMNLGEAWEGYVYQLDMLFHTFRSSIGLFRWDYLWLAAAPMVFAGFTVFSLSNEETDGAAIGTGYPRRYYVLFVPGLVLLAILSYLPFSVSTVRFDITRQMLAAGIFIYMILLLIPFDLLPRYMPGKYITPLLLALVTWGVVAVGTDIRSFWVDVYRNQEKLLAAIATVIPDPPPGALILVHLGWPYELHVLQAFENRWDTFDHAIGFMYGDDSLSTGFIDLFNYAPFAFDRKGVTINTSLPINQGRHVLYGKLILVDYLPDGSARILGRDWLLKFAPAGTDLSAYKPGGYGTAPGPGSNVCRMLEKQFRPAYCE